MTVLALGGNGERAGDFVCEVYGDYDRVMTEDVMDRTPIPATLICNSLSDRCLLYADPLKDFGIGP
jgi:hypothetical protein